MPEVRPSVAQDLPRLCQDPVGFSSRLPKHAVALGRGLSQDSRFLSLEPRQFCLLSVDVEKPLHVRPLLHQRGNFGLHGLDRLEPPLHLLVELSHRRSHVCLRLHLNVLALGARNREAVRDAPRTPHPRPSCPTPRGTCPQSRGTWAYACGTSRASSGRAAPSPLPASASPGPTTGTSCRSAFA